MLRHAAAGPVLFSVACLALVLAAGGCSASQARLRAMESPDPAQRARAAVAAGQARDTSAAHHLVGLLEDPDAGVRFCAIGALKRIYGDDLGYRYFDPRAAREAAAERWRQARRQGSVHAVAERDEASVHPRGVSGESLGASP